MFAELQPEKNQSFSKNSHYQMSIVFYSSFFCSLSTFTLFSTGSYFKYIWNVSCINNCCMCPTPPLSQGFFQSILDLPPWSPPPHMWCETNRSTAASIADTILSSQLAWTPAGVVNYLMSGMYTSHWPMGWCALLNIKIKSHTREFTVPPLSPAHWPSTSHFLLSLYPSSLLSFLTAGM